MYFADLSVANYAGQATSQRAWKVPLLAIGWLDQQHPFATGTLPPEFRQRLDRLFDPMPNGTFEPSFRGLHECSLCGARGHLTPILRSSTNRFVPAPGRVYLVTGGIFHYLDQHAYCPPQEFIDALMQCPDPASPAYRAALLGAMQTPCASLPAGLGRRLQLLRAARIDVALIVNSIAVLALVLMLDYLLLPWMAGRVAAYLAPGAASDRALIRQMEAAGTRLDRPHHVEFFIYLPSEPAAQELQRRLLPLGLQATSSRSPYPETPWLVRASRDMILDEDALIGLRRRFEALCVELHCEYDGWGAPIVH